MAPLTLAGTGRTASPERPGTPSPKGNDHGTEAMPAVRQQVRHYRHPARRQAAALPEQRRPGQVAGRRLEFRNHRRNTMSLPILTAEQRAAALLKAAESRRARSAALGELASGKLTLAAVLAGEESRLQRAFVRQVLRALPGVGDVTADKALSEVGIDRKRRVGGLGDRQRAALAERFAA